MYIMGNRHNTSKHVNSIPENVGIDFLMFVLKSCSGKGQYSLMPRKTICCGLYFVLIEQHAAVGTSVLQDKAWEAYFVLKLQTAFGNASLRSSSASLHVNEDKKSLNF